jgi:membrane-associated phospholipid phosphatase
MSLLVIELALFSRFLLYVEARKGIYLDDPLFRMFEAIDLNVVTFSILYITLISGLTALSFNPRIFNIAIQTYILMVIFRTAAMYVTPLEPPIGTIDLLDPVVFMVGTGGTRLTKDLFFSGHTATLFIFFLALRNKLRYAFLAAAAAIALCVVLQKAHYTIDVLAAPFFAYTAYRIILLMHGKESKNEQC